MPVTPRMFFGEVLHGTSRTRRSFSPTTTPLWTRIFLSIPGTRSSRSYSPAGTFTSNDPSTSRFALNPHSPLRIVAWSSISVGMVSSGLTYTARSSDRLFCRKNVCLAVRSRCLFESSSRRCFGLPQSSRPRPCPRAFQESFQCRVKELSMTLARKKGGDLRIVDRARIQQLSEINNRVRLDIQHIHLAPKLLSCHGKTCRRCIVEVCEVDLSGIV